MSKCHAAYFCKGWENARGCRIEHDAAIAYGLKIIYEDEWGQPSEKNLSIQIIKELCTSMQGISKGGWNASKALCRVFYKEAERMGADIEILSLIGSWGDTLPDEDMLSFIKEYNENRML